MPPKPALWTTDPGTSAPGVILPKLVAVPVSGVLASALGARAVRAWTMGACRIVRGEYREGLRLTISCTNRYPTWDEVRVARYRTLPLDRTFALALPPPEDYIDPAGQTFTLELSEMSFVPPAKAGARKGA